MTRLRRVISVAACGSVLASLAPATAAAAGAVTLGHRSGSRGRTVFYRGARFVVPRGWPVYDLAADPAVCVRFNRAAVYLGRPSTGQQCPAGAAVGRSRAILIEPDGRGAVIRRSAASASALNGAAGLREALARAASGGAATTGTASSATGTTTPAGTTPATGTTPPAATPPEPYTGLGFDACAAPSVRGMAAWRASPFRAVGIYIGGANMACAQPNLDTTWVRHESAADWHLIPTYVGLQAPVNSCGCASISRSDAAGEGSAAATDAAGNAYSLGIGRGNPLYLDVEYYPRTPANTIAVLTYVAAWTSQLHAYGYKSGVYGNSDSLIADLVNEQGTSYPEPDDIWFAEWNGERTIDTAWAPAQDWSSHRLHQFSGAHNARFGGATMNIDTNYVDGDTAEATTGSAPIPDGTFVQPAGTQALYRIAGGAPLAVSDWGAFGGPQPYTVVSPQQFAQLNNVPVSGTFLETSTGAIYRVAGGAPLPVSSWSVFGGRQPAVGIDEWDIENISNPEVHLNATPADGTIVEGLPSRTYWMFEGGSLTEAAANPFATRVNDPALAAFPRLPCIVPSLGRKTLAGARVALRAADCRLGAVVRQLRRRPRHPHVARVVAQTPAAGTQQAALAPVGVTVH